MNLEFTYAKKGYAKNGQSLLTFSQSAGEKNILRSVLLSNFLVFIFSMPSKVILIVIEFMFLGINMFLSRTPRTVLS